VEANSSRWNEITPSPHPHERAALEHVRELLPDRHPYQAWSNFTFLSDQGRVREVDLLVAGPTGLYLVEIKNFRGRLTNHNATWVLQGDHSRRSFDNPLPLADQKAKELKGLLTRAAAKDRGVRAPFLRAVIFLAEPGMTCELDAEHRHGLYGPQGGRQLDQIGDDLLLAPITRTPPQPEFLRALPRLLERVGIHRTRRSITVGPWQIDPRPYDQGPTWQDHHATREDVDAAYRRIRIYLYERESDPDTRESIRRAAQREFSVGQGVQHPGLLVPRELLDHEMGPALIIEQEHDALRLDYYLAQHGGSLDLPARLGMVRQLAEAVHYAHARRLVHRVLAPRAVMVERGDSGWNDPRLRVGEWQAAARGLSSSTTRHRVAPTTNAGQHVEAAAAAYLAPEFTAEADGTVSIDVFGLGATGYLILTGRSPAEGRAQLMDRLATDGGLHPSAVSDTVPPDVDALIALATAPVVNDRYADVEQFLEHLDGADRQPVDDAANPTEADPWDATEGTELPDGSVVLRVLGTGATARAFHVRRDGLDSVLKVGRNAQAEQRLDDEATALEGLRHEHLVILKRGVFPLGPRHAIEIDYAGQRTLAQILRQDGALLPDQLQRFGDQLLDVLDYLQRRDIFHRDIKPDNLAVRSHPKRGAALVLFDFSLAGAPGTDVLAGTRGYRDPLLGTDRRPTYDAAAERYAAAVTLHEMASLELPVWGDDGTDARFVQQVTLSAELFDAGLREPLTEFFQRALHRDAEQRYDSMGSMREAWQRVFTTIDEERPATTSYSDSEDLAEQRDEIAERAGADTALAASGLSMRAVAVAERLGASTVGDLVEIPTRALWRARGLPRTTRTELVARASQWRRAVANAGPTSADSQPTGVDAGLLTLDKLAARLMPEPSRRDATRPELIRQMLGLPDAQGALPPARWPTRAEVATASGLTGARVAQVMGAQRKQWAKDPSLRVVRDELVAALEGLSRVAAAAELVDQLLMARGCAREEDPERRRAYGYAIVRAVVEADAVADVVDVEPRFATRRHDGRMLVALQVGEDEALDTPGDGLLLDFASSLADEAARLAIQDPLPTPVAVVRALRGVAERAELVYSERRLVQLAAAATGTVLANARLELYPRDLDPVRALRLAQAGTGIPRDGVEPEWFDTRVRARFPGLASLPGGRELARLLRESGAELRWDGARFAPERQPTGYTSLGTSTSAGAAASAGGTAAADVSSRLARVAEHGGMRVITMRRSRWAQGRARLADALDVPVRDAGSEFVAALRAVATERKIPDFAVVLRADAAEPGSRDHTNLQRVVAAVFERLEQDWSRPGVLALEGLTPLGRYAGGPPLLERLADRARRAGRDGGPSALVLLCPAEDERQPPRIGNHAVGLVTPEEWIVGTSAWLSGEAVPA